MVRAVRAVRRLASEPVGWFFVLATSMVSGRWGTAVSSESSSLCIIATVNKWFHFLC